MKIYRAGVDIHDITIDKRTVLNKKLMGEDKITCPIVVSSPLDLKEGDYTIFQGENYYINRPPKAEKAKNNEFKYNIELEGEIYGLIDRIFLLNGDADFPLVGTLDDFIDLLITNANRDSSGWTKGVVIETERKNLLFDGENCRSVLARLANEFSCEFYLTGKQINYSELIEKPTSHVFEVGKGKGLYSLTRDNVDSDNTVTRAYIYGGEKNLDYSYRNGEKRLVFEERFLENLSEYSKIVEKKITFEDVYPHFQGTITSVSGENGKVVKCTAIDFDINTQLLEGLTAKVSFLTGDLMGKELEIASYNHSSKEITLIPATEEDLTLPGAEFQAKANDIFTLIDLKMPDVYITNAEAELKAKGQKWLDYHKQLRVKYTLKQDPRHLLKNNISLCLGDLVRAKDSNLSIDKQIRIIGFKQSILNPFDITSEIANHLEESWEREITAQINKTQSQVVLNKTEQIYSLNLNKDWIARNFAKLSGGNILSGDQTINGHLLVNGNITQTGQAYITHAQHVNVESNLMQLNKGETAAQITGVIPGTSTAFSGLEINRGSADPYYLGVVEGLHPLIKLGKKDSLVTLAARADSITDNYMLKWDNTSKKIVGERLVSDFWHKDNSNKSDVDWTARTLYATGLYRSGTGDLNLGNTSGGAFALGGDSGSSRFYAKNNHLELGTSRDGDSIYIKSGASKTTRISIGGTGNISLHENTSIEKGNDLKLRNTDNSSYIYLRNNGAHNQRNLSLRYTATGEDILTIDNGGKVGIGTTKPVEKLDVNGNIVLSGHIGSSNYTSGAAGEGWRISKQANGEVNNWSVRQAFTCNTFTNNKINISNGDLIVSDSDKIEFVYNNWLYFSKERPFQVGDVLKCQSSKQADDVKSYYITVTAINISASYKDENGEFLKNLSYNNLTGTGTPEIGDVLVRWDSSIEERKGLLYLSSSSQYAPFYDVVYGGKTKARFGNLGGITSHRFGVLSGFSLWAEDAYIEGTVNAKAGYIANCTINKDSVSTDGWTLYSSGAGQLANGALTWDANGDNFRFANNVTLSWNNLDPTAQTNLKGEKGDTGAKGNDGTNGTNGADGQNGAQGDKGDRGEQGLRGLQGIQGLEGIQGLRGIPGINGTTPTSNDIKNTIINEAAVITPTIVSNLVNTNSIVANMIDTSTLKVGDNIAMGDNAVIKWSQVSETNALTNSITTAQNTANNAYDLAGEKITSEQATTITKNTITAAYINTFSLNSTKGNIGSFIINSSAIHKINGLAKMAIGNSPHWTSSWNGLHVGRDSSNRIWVGSNGTGEEIGVYQDGGYVFRAGYNGNTIGGWNFDTQYMWSGIKKASNGYTTSGMTLASAGAIRAKEFRIDTNGSAHFKGNLESPSGAIGGFTIGSTFITNVDSNNNGIKLGSDGVISLSNPLGGVSNKLIFYYNGSTEIGSLYGTQTSSSTSSVVLNSEGRLTIKADNEIYINGKVHINGLKQVHGSFTSTTDGNQTVTVAGLTQLKNIHFNVLGTLRGGSTEFTGLNNRFVFNRDDGISGSVIVNYIAWGQ